MHTSSLMLCLPGKCDIIMLGPFWLALSIFIIIIIWDFFREKGPNAYILKFPVSAIEM